MEPMNKEERDIRRKLKVLHPAILRNDGRSLTECTELEVAVPEPRANADKVAIRRLDRAPIVEEA
ncbi:hypothetical protein [Sphingorhabdus sp.]|jgi:hypothetical protein|uniref:hypothetical protein n=1 Tax=Sphingorhabdus sp. TaxID=1902408 RepID=UPI0037C65886